MSKLMDNLLNKEFGRLVVIAQNGYVKQGNKNLFSWKCKCKCGNECVVLHQNLRRGSTKSCGCLRKELATKDLINQQFGYLTVIEKIGYIFVDANNRAAEWKCLCSCGNVCFVKTNLLCNGHVKSCGCFKKGKKRKNLAGSVFGEVRVLEFFESKNNRTFWLCECSCGKTKSIDGHHLVTGNQKSCGCRRGGWKHGLTKNKKEYYKYLMSDPVRKLRHRISRQVRKYLLTNKNGSIMKYLPYTIEELRKHIENLWEPWMHWNNYGGMSNDKNKTWWIDHIIPQSKLRYTSMNDPNFVKCWGLPNLRPLEKIANIKKGANVF
jgi:hypothetical protein